MALYGISTRGRLVHQAVQDDHVLPRGHGLRRMAPHPPRRRHRPNLAPKPRKSCTARQTAVLAAALVKPCGVNSPTVTSHRGGGTRAARIASTTSACATEGTARVKIDHGWSGRSCAHSSTCGRGRSLRESSSRARTRVLATRCQHRAGPQWWAPKEASARPQQWPSPKNIEICMFSEYSWRQRSFQAPPLLRIS